MDDKGMHTNPQESNENLKSTSQSQNDDDAPLANDGAPLYHPPPIIHRRNNIQHVVPVGMLIVLFTLYLTPNALQRNYGNCHVTQESNKMDSLSSAGIASEVQRLKGHARGMPIANRLLEHANVCMDLEIFTKDMKNACDNLTWMNLAHTELVKRAKEHNVENVDSGRAKSISANKIKAKRSTASLRRQAKRATGHRHSNGHMYNNRSATKSSKTLEKPNALKKDQKEPKKSSTAEPIIYLFALVFIYLLLKAASDINQHYKLQSKGDKRLRRCSLQSYAQSHKQDRRASASKDSLIRQRQRLLEFRSVSVDRSTTGAISSMSEYAERKTEILANLRKHTSMEGPAAAQLLLKQTQDNSGLPSWMWEKNVFPRTPANSTVMLASLTRRCSVPVGLNQQLKLTVSLAPMDNTSRRTSIASGNIAGSTAGDHFESFDMQFPENRRRVRMINRH